MAIPAPILELVERFKTNHDAVPDEKLVSCCYWEYAREPVFI